MKFSIVSTERSKEAIEQLESAGYAYGAVGTGISSSGAGDRLSDDILAELRARLISLMGEYSEQTAKFDAEACVVIHSLLPMDPEMLSNDGFWRWVAITQIPDVIKWRFPPSASESGEEAGPPMVKRQNFGVGSSARQRAECFPYKLWLRGELGHVSEKGDLYRFAKRGDVDFWTSHIHRQSYTTNRRLCSLLVRFQYPDSLGGMPRLLHGQEDPAKGKLGIRTLAKRIRRLQASYELALLSDDQLLELIEEQSAGLQRNQ